MSKGVQTMYTRNKSGEQVLKLSIVFLISKGFIVRFHINVICHFVRSP